MKIDIEDIDLVTKYRWSLWWNEWIENFYVMCHTVIGGNRKTIYVHRLIMDVVNDTNNQVDHINGDTLDNRKSNLRVCTRAQNMENRPRGANKNNKTGVRNVYIHKCKPNGLMYVARIALRGKPICEYFPFTDEGFEQAKFAAKRLRREHFTHSQ